MKKVAIVFVLAVFVPSLVLAWLAVRSLRDQQLVLERQRSLLYQNVADTLARDVQNLVVTRQHEFAAQVDAVLANENPAMIAMTFDDRLRTNWHLGHVGFAVAPGGMLCSPTVTTRSEAARTFLLDNGSFVANRESAEVYWSRWNGIANTGNSYDPANNARSAEENSQLLTGNPSDVNPKKSFQGKNLLRNVNPQQQAAVPPAKGQSQMDESQLNTGNLSKVAPAEAEFQTLIGGATEGTLARFVNNKLNVLFWHRSPQDSNFVFGAQVDLSRLIGDVRAWIKDAPDRLLPGSEWGLYNGRTSPHEVCIAVLDEKARPVAISVQGFSADWKRPFVSAEIGEELPHWEVAAYLINPGQINQTARTVRLTLGLLIAVLVLAIGIGSWLIVHDLNRQLALARQKTDFVSNVSHELKTPLTSIRMFSELLAEERVTDPAKQRSYLNIVTAETARLTRLINNVLDFSRMERGEKKYNFRDGDLVGIVRETAETYRPHLENAGFTLECALPATELPVRADTDAVAQIIVNLLSNAEKYSNSRKEISIRVGRRDGPLPCAEVSVMDRGLGVPRGSEERIFQQFYRAHDSLSSGIQGSGLGLTLARQIARAHGGDVVYEPRDGGGSCFSLRLPIVDSMTADPRKL